MGPRIHAYRGLPVTETTTGDLLTSVVPVTKGSVSLGTAGGYGQSWTSGASPTAITGVAFLFNPNGARQRGRMVARIYAHSGTFGTNSIPTGAPLVESDHYDMYGMSDNETWYFFPLSGWTPDPTTNYVAVVEGYDNLFADGSNSNLVVTDAVTGFDGNYSSVGTNHATWSSAANDLGFRLYAAASGGGGDDDILRLRDGTYRRRLSWGLGLVAMLSMLGCEEQILQVGDDPARDDCRWVVTADHPAVVTLEDIERCVGNIEFLVFTNG